MKGSFLIKASDLLTKNSIFHGAVVLKIDDVEYLEKGVLFLTPKGFNIRFLYGQECMTVWLGNDFNCISFKHYKDASLDNDQNGIYCFNFDLGIYKNGRNNYYFTKSYYPGNKISFYYESSLANYKKETRTNYSSLDSVESRYYFFDGRIVRQHVNLIPGYVTVKISKAHKEKGLNKINDALLEVYKPNWVFYKIERRCVW